MKKHRLILGTVVALLFLVSLTPQFAILPPAGKSLTLKDAPSQSVSGGQNTSVVQTHHGETLLAHYSENMNGWLARHFPQVARFADLPEVLPLYTLRLDIHAEDRGYDLRVQDLKEKCGFAAFSDGEGVIWRGKWID